MPFCSGVEGEKWNFLMIDLRDDLVTGYLMPPMLISNVLDMTYWPARTYLKIIDHMFTVQRECGNGPLQAMLSGDVINLRGCVRRNSGPSGGRENRHGCGNIPTTFKTISLLIRTHKQKKRSFLSRHSKFT